MVFEMIISILQLFSDPIKDYIVIPIKRHISYPFTLDNNLDGLHHEVEQLQNDRDRLQQYVDDSRRNAKQIFPNVTDWLSTAEKDIEEAEELIQRKEEAKKKCCVGFCPNLKSRYQLSEKAHKKALAMDQQLQKAQEWILKAQGLDPIAFRPPPQPIVEPSMYSREALPSRVLVLNKTMDALKDPNLNTIGVYGMGGVGKTTLAKEVFGQAVELKTLFETVVLVDVSQTPDLRRIQGDIADALGLKFEAEQVSGRARQLHSRLKEAKILIILDDVWQKLDLDAIGIPSRDASKGCKIFLTSRRKDILSNEMRTQREFPLDLLKDEETWRLFEKSVSMANDPEFMANDSELRALANDVAKKCAGLPLLIQKVSTDLRNNKHRYAWEDMLKQLQNVEGTEIYEIVHKVIESSYEKLKNEEAKALFLLCAHFGSSNIEIRDLLIYCTGLGLFKHMDSIEGSRNKVLTLIDKLKNESLLLDGDKAGFVKIHDVVRDIANAIALRQNCAFVGKGQIRSTDLESKDCRRVSLPYCDIRAIPEVLQCPEAEVFSLFGEDLSLDIPNSFFEGARKLKVLHFSGVSFVSGLPSSLGFLTSLQTLSLHRCKLNNVVLIAELKQLEVLSFAGSDIEELPREIKALTRLKLLDLTDCYYLKVIPSNVLSNLSLLEELYIYNFHGWEEEGNASLVELKNLSRLTSLEIVVQDDKLLPENWFFDGIQNYKIIIGSGHWINRFHAKETSRMLKLELKTSIGLMHRIKEFMGGTEVLYLSEVKGVENLLYDSSMEKIGSFQRLRFLSISDCDSLRELLPFSSEKCLLHLQEIGVYSCSNMEAIFGDGNEDEVMEFTQLTSLKLTSLPHLRGICRTSATVVSFPNLTSLGIYHCHSLKYVFTTVMAKSLKQLKKLEIKWCSSMEDIIHVTKFEEVDNINMIVFPELDFLQLDKLRNLKRFSSGYPIEFPKLGELMLKDCGEMKNFVSKYSDRSNSNESTDECLFNDMVSFPNLTSLEIYDCHSLNYVFTTAMVKSLKQLKRLKIKWCNSMEEIIHVTKFEEVDKFNMIVFPELEFLQLCILGNLKRFSSGYPIEFPKLRELMLKECGEMKNFVSKYSDRSNSNESTDECLFNDLASFPNLTSLGVFYCWSLKYVFTTSMVRSLKQLKKIEIIACELMEEIILVSKFEEVAEDSINMIVFPELDFLHLRGLSSLKSFNSRYPIGFPKLRELMIFECHKLKNFVCKDLDRRNNSNESTDES